MSEEYNTFDHEDDQHLVDVSSLDFTGMAMMMTQQLGVTVSEETLKLVMIQSVSMRPNLSGRTMVLVRNTESLTTMTSVGNNFSEEIRDSMSHIINLQPAQVMGIINDTMPEGNDENSNAGVDETTGFVMDVNNHDDAIMGLHRLMETRVRS